MGFITKIFKGGSNAGERPPSTRPPSIKDVQKEAAEKKKKLELETQKLLLDRVLMGAHRFDNPNSFSNDTFGTNNYYERLEIANSIKKKMKEEERRKLLEEGVLYRGK